MYRITRIRRRTAIVLDDFHKEIQKRMRSTEDGFAMAMVVFIVMIISLLGLSMLTVAAYQMRDSDRTLPSNRAFDLADAGLSYAHGYLAQDNVIPDPTASPGYYDSHSLQMGDSNSTFDVTIAKVTDGSNNVVPFQYRIVSTGTYSQNESGTGSTSNRTYTRKLEEKVKYRGTANHLDTFNYLMYSDKGDVTLDTGRGYFSGDFVTYSGDIYAGNNANVWDKKNVAAVGSVAVHGDVTAGNNADLQATNSIAAIANDSVDGDVTAGNDITVNSRSAVLAGAQFVVGGSLNAGRDINLSSSNIVAAVTYTGVAQKGTPVVNAGRDINISSSVGGLAGASVDVGNSGATASVNASGDFNMSSNAPAAAGSSSTVYGSVNAMGQANMSADSVFLSSAASKVTQNMKCNEDSTLDANSGLSSSTINIGGTWQMGGNYSNSGSCSWGSRVHSNPGITGAPVQAVPDVALPEPDWSWYKTMAIAQGHYYSTSQNLSSVSIAGDASSMWVMYVAGDLTLTNVNYQNINVNGVIVCEGNFTVNGNVNWKNNTQYQVIAKGDITHANGGTTYNAVNDTVFLYTDGSKPGSNGNIVYDLAWFNKVKGQFTAKGNISAASGRGWITNPEIDYQAPSVAAAAWPIPFDVMSFREL